METKLSDLELAICTLVSEFHKAAGGSADMNLTQFQTMISKQMPKYAEMVEKEDRLLQDLNKMGVTGSDNISFEKFWIVIESEATKLLDATRLAVKKKSTMCSCALL